MEGYGFILNKNSHEIRQEIIHRLNLMQQNENVSLKDKEMIFSKFSFNNAWEKGGKGERERDLSSAL